MASTVPPEYYVDEQYSHVPNVLTPSQETIAYCHSILVLDPYGGCLHQCRFCYVTMGLARIHNQAFNRVIPVRSKLPEKFERFLKKYHEIKYPVRISSNCDPFQPVEQDTKLTHRLLRACSEYSYPVVLNTKGQIPADTIALVEELNAKNLIQVQISFISLNSQIANVLEPNVPVATRVSLVEDLTSRGIPVSIRFQPIIPGINSSTEKISEFLAWTQSAGVRHIIASFLRIKKSVLSKLYAELESTGFILESTIATIKDLQFWDDDGFYLHPNYQYREQRINFIRQYCDTHNLLFSTCKEPFHQFHSIDDCCGGIYTRFSHFWTPQVILRLPKNVQRVFVGYPQVQNFLPPPATSFKDLSK